MRRDKEGECGKLLSLPIAINSGTKGLGSRKARERYSRVSEDLQCVHKCEIIQEARGQISGFGL